LEEYYYYYYYYYYFEGPDNTKNDDYEMTGALNYTPLLLRNMQICGPYIAFFKSREVKDRNVRYLHDRMVYKRVLQVLPERSDCG
jgi:hypothetical protein